MLNRTLSSLRRSVDGAGVLTIGGVLTLLAWTVTPLWIGSVVAFPPLIALAPLALAPAFVTRGYFVRVLSDGVATGNEAGAPPFVAWNELYRNGVKSAILSAILLAPLALLFGLLAVAGIIFGTGLIAPAAVVGPLEHALGGDGIVALIGLGGGLLGVVSAAYLLVFAYVRPAALTAFAVSGRLRDGLYPRRVSRIAASSGYATAWVVAAVTLLIGYALAAPFVPVVIGVVIVFVTRVVAYALYGHGAGLRAVTSDERDTTDAGSSAEVDGPVDGERVEDAESDSTRFPTAPQRPAPEAPPTVQAGRAVSFGGDIDRLVGDGVGDGVPAEASDGVPAEVGDGVPPEVGDGVPPEASDGVPAGGPERFEWATSIDDETPTGHDDNDLARADGTETSGESGDDRISGGGFDGVAFDWEFTDIDREDKS